ncbi:MAG: fluoride efflux transporter CrcB, partial [Propionibacteriales bacterium]|nr:fluoride efflux transporter CrcB [Propionibacteriales bacterium]
MTALLVALGGAAGAAVRFRLGVRFNGRQPMPLGTLAANVVAALLLGVFARSAGEQVYALLGVGFCGGLSTYSTFAWETHSLATVNRVHALTYQLTTI